MKESIIFVLLLTHTLYLYPISILLSNVHKTAFPRQQFSYLIWFLLLMCYVISQNDLLMFILCSLNFLRHGKTQLG
jgi:hypothetical protein